MENSSLYKLQRGLAPLTLTLKALNVFQGILGSAKEDKPSLANTRDYEIIQ